METKIEKTFPKVGDELYLQQRTGNYWVDMVKRPYTVIGVTNSTVIVQSAKCIFNGPQYYDTLADDIVADPNGEIVVLHWSAKKGKWQNSKDCAGYPEYAFFGKYEFQPYLD